MLFPIWNTHLGIYQIYSEACWPAEKMSEENGVSYTDSDQLIRKRQNVLENPPPPLKLCIFMSSPPPLGFPLRFFKNSLPPPPLTKFLEISSPPPPPPAPSERGGGWNYVQGRYMNIFQINMANHWSDDMITNSFLIVVTLDLFIWK